MNRVNIIKLSIIASLCWMGSVSTMAHQMPASPTIVYDATEDFDLIDKGSVPYYIDKRNDALAIDARVLDYRGLFARASTIYEGPDAVYDITITPMTEEDGEPLYRLLINEQLLGTYRASYIGEDHPQDLQAERHIWHNIALSSGDTISVESVAHTNGEIPENDGTAWARGRWQSLALAPASSLSASPAPASAALTKVANFRKHTDLLVSQFDFQPDADDVHSVAALGSMLVHPDMQGIKHIAVAGTVGIQDGNYVNANSLMEMAFGRENLNWTDAKAKYDDSVTLLRNRVRATLSQGGKVWVQEAGQSDFTAAWIQALIDVGVHESLIKNNITVVQHSEWNEKHTSPQALGFVKDKVQYRAITDGNKPKQVFKRKNRRGPFTPMYVDKHSRWLESAVSPSNSYAHARKLWQEAQSIIQKHDFKAEYSVIPTGGVDFSDNVELWWILGLGQEVVSVHAFWDRYVSDVPLDTINPPAGRLAVVIDGNSPDPDDIGATPVMLALLQQAKLSERLVHLSHSCDLDPFRNKGRQIGPEDEARRQKVLHELSGKGIELFGPFKNLRDYYNCRTDQDAARDDLVDAINASTAQNPLWIIEAGEPDLIGYALEKANPQVMSYVHVVSHHPANDDSGDYFTWQQILDFGVIEHQIGDQNVSLQTPIHLWDWAKEHQNPGYQFIWEMLAYAEQDGVVPFQANKFDCSDAGMIYWWITGANEGGNKFSRVSDIRDMLLVKND